MKTSYNYYIILLSLLIALGTISCVKYDASPFIGKTLPRKTDYSNDWLYYNLTEDRYLNPNTSSDSINGNKAKIIEGKQFDRTDWDIAFNRYNIRTNSGLSGNGKGGAYDMGLVKYNSITSTSQIPKNAKFTVDSIYQITMSKNEWIRKHFHEKNEPWFDPNTGPKQMKSTANTLLGNALRFSGPPPIYTPSNHVYILRTSNGKNYFKLLVISWYNQDKQIGQRGGRISFMCDKLKNEQN